MDHDGRVHTGFYEASSRELQDQFDTRRLADRLEEVQVHTRFTANDRALIEGARMFFLATADAHGHPECSYKGGLPGFVRVLNDHTLAFPDYNGNGMFRSLGNVSVNHHVALLFVDFAHPYRLRINGEATFDNDDPLLAEYDGAQLIVRIEATHIFPNCPRYVHQMRVIKESVYVPAKDRIPPVPMWKQADDIRDALPPSEITPRSLGAHLRRLQQRHVLFNLLIGGIVRARRWTRRDD